LAILQADFGCHREAIPAMREAISIARENKDVTCLNFCMSWLYHFGKAFPAEMKEMKESGMLGSENEALAFLKTRAKDAEMWNLLSTTLLSEAKLGLQSVGSQEEEWILGSTDISREKVSPLPSRPSPNLHI
jgi:anaphase-promoting complex subunit 5